MSAWDWFTLAMFAVCIFPFAAFAVILWREERRR